jgi:hypothetical protein
MNVAWGAAYTMKDGDYRLRRNSLRCPTTFWFYRLRLLDIDSTGYKYDTEVFGSFADDNCLDYILHLERRGRSRENKFPNSTPGQRLHEATQD